MNTREMIEIWDKGGNIASIEMGGLGPGYEQAIQVTAIEFAREGLDFDFTAPDADARWRANCERVLRRIDEQVGGLTGAMFGAASSLAYLWVKLGPEGFEEKVRHDGKADRLILVSNFFPKVSPPSAAEGT